MTPAEQLANLATGPYLAACSLLVVAGFAKLRSRRALLGTGEIATGLTGAVVGGPAAAIVAFAYVALAVYAAHLLRHAPDKPCECLGTVSAPATRAHVALNLGAAAFACLAVPGDTPAASLADQPLAGVPFVGLVACAAWLGALVLGAYADVRASSSGGHR